MAHTFRELEDAQKAGKRVQWMNTDGSWVDGNMWGFMSSSSYYRIVEDEPVKDKHVHYDLIVAWAEGAEIEYYSETYSRWLPDKHPCWGLSLKFRIKPESTPDKVVYAHVKQEGVHSAKVLITSEHNWNSTGMPAYTSPVNTKIVFDGRTGELKSIELIG